MHPSQNPDPSQKSAVDGASIRGRPSISIDSFRDVAREVAETLGQPIAICRRDDREAGSSATPFQNIVLSEAQNDGSNILEIVNPPARGVTSAATSQEGLRTTVAAALAQIPEGPSLDRYFGISTGEPEQSSEEAARADNLIQDLKRASPEGEADLSGLLSKIGLHAASSGANADALRSLMRGGSPQKESWPPSDGV